MVTSVKYTELPQLSLQGKLIKSRRTIGQDSQKENKRENSKQEKEKRL